MYAYEFAKTFLTETLTPTKFSDGFSKRFSYFCHRLFQSG